MIQDYRHPATPPPELVEQWCEQLFGCPDKPEIAAYELVRLGAQWGADQELEACCEWLQDPDLNVDTYKLRADRRPKPPSLKEQALNEFDSLVGDSEAAGAAVILRALEALPDD